jgi:tetratricopeptide (TPR) repeat protein
MTEPKHPPPSDGASELPEELRRRLDSLDQRLATIDHYALLGVPRSATRAQIRSAFLTAAPAFHPDRYFGKNIGANYSAKMQRVFARMAMAHDSLLNDEQRAKYDRTLPAAVAPPSSPPTPTPLPATNRPPEPVRRAESSPAPARRVESSPAPAGTIHARVPSPSEADRARAQAFAARLAGAGRMRQATPVQPFHGTGTPRPPSPISSASNPAVDPKAAVDALRRRYEQSVARANSSPGPSNVHAAETAAARGDHAEAARLYRAALEQASDPTQKATLVQAENHEKEQQRTADMAKAKEAEQRQEFAAAAAAWARAFDAGPNADVANRAALCFRRAGTDLRRATRYGEEAVKLDPNKAAYRVNLALAYADAGLGRRARGEIDRALALDPQSATAREAAQRIKSMG